MECIVCKEKILKSAKYCSKCSHYQAAWKNNLKFIASIVTVITLFLSGVFYMFSQAPTIIKNFFPNKDIEVVDFASGLESSGTIFFNPGEDEVWIGTGQLKSDYFNATLPINTKVMPRSFAVHKKFNGADGKLEAKKSYPVFNIAPEKWRELIAGDHCHELVFFGRNNLNLKLLQNHSAGKLSHAPGKLTLNFYNSVTMEWLQKTIPIVAVLEKYPGYCL